MSMVGEATIECSRCGEIIEIGGTHVCPEEGAVAAADGCPMCGEKYESWLDHLRHEH